MNTPKFLTASNKVGRIIILSALVLVTGLSAFGQTDDKTKAEQQAQKKLEEQDKKARDDGYKKDQDKAIDQYGGTRTKEVMEPNRPFVPKYKREKK